MIALGLRHRALVDKENVALLPKNYQAQPASAWAHDSDDFTQRVKSSVTPQIRHAPSALKDLWTSCLALSNAAKIHIPGHIERAVICALATSSKDDRGALAQWDELLVCCKEASLPPKFMFGIWQHGGRTVLQWLLEAKALRSFQKVTDGLPAGKYPGGIAIKVMRETDRRFAGQIKNGVYHGYGVFQWLPGFQMVAEEQAVYRGEFRKGWINGQGRTEYALGHVYDGHYLNGRKHGHGMYKWSSGRIFEGEFNDGSFVKGEWVFIPCLPSNREKVYAQYRKAGSLEEQINLEWSSGPKCA